MKGAVSNMDEKYSFEFTGDRECWLAGYREYVKAISKKRIIIDCVVFGILSLLFIQQVAIKPDYGVGWICLAISVFMIVLTFITPLRQIKSVDATLDDIDGRKYILKIYDDKYSVEGAIDGAEPDVTSLAEKSLKAYDREKYYLIFAKDSFCVVPKADLSEADSKAVSELIEKISKI